MDTKPITHKIMELSTAHLQPTTLEHWLPDRSKVQPSSYIGYPYGWILSAKYLIGKHDDASSECSLPADVEEVCRCAVSSGCAYLMLDGDAAVLATLTDYSEAYE